MFVVKRKLKGKERWGILICESQRIGKKIKQKTIKYFGIAHGIKNCNTLYNQACEELKAYKQAKAPISDELKETPSKKSKQIIEIKRVCRGFHDVFEPYFEKLKLQTSFSKIRYEQLKNLVIARIASPCSKLRTARILQNTFDKTLSADQIYDLMDLVIEKEDEIKTKVFELTQKRQKNQPINLLLFDVTTLYFESQKKDEIRDFGYSKDHKVNEVQIVLALATTSNGSPIGYHLFSGKTAEAGTLLNCLTEWKKLFPIKNCIIVADRAMLSKKNLSLMEEENITYVVAAKLRSLPEKLKNEILDKSKNGLKADDSIECLNIQEHEHLQRRLVVSYSKSRALKDADDRTRLISKLQEKLKTSKKPQNLISNRGYLKFAKEKTEGMVEIDSEAIETDALWDGLHGVFTNDKTSSALDLLNRYKNLWVIEESFRINKTNLAMRPIYHFNPKRIKAHVLVCYLAYSLVRYANQDINAEESFFSIERMQEELQQVEESVILDEFQDKTFLVPGKLSPISEKIYEILNIKKSKFKTLKM